MVLTGILRGFFILELDQLRMLQKLKSWPLQIFSGYTPATTSDSAKGTTRY